VFIGVIVVDLVMLSLRATGYLPREGMLHRCMDVFTLQQASIFKPIFLGPQCRRYSDNTCADATCSAAVAKRCAMV
jgi:hypothetical protein